MLYLRSILKRRKKKILFVIQTMEWNCQICVVTVLFSICNVLKKMCPVLNRAPLYCLSLSTLPRHPPLNSPQSSSLNPNPTPAWLYPPQGSKVDHCRAVQYNIGPSNLQTGVLHVLQYQGPPKTTCAA